MNKDEDESSAYGDHAGEQEATMTDRERLTLARKEDLVVQWMRGAVFLVLLCTAALVASGIFVVIRRDQIEDFKTSFAADAGKVLDTFNRAVERRLEAIDALSISITAYARESNSTFPNVTVSDFEVRAANVRVLADTSAIHYTPIVTNQARKGWEAYQIANRDRNFDLALASEIAMREHQDKEFQELSDRQLQAATPVVLRDEITTLDATGTYVIAPQGSGPFLPSTSKVCSMLSTLLLCQLTCLLPVAWQMSPVLPDKSLLNADMLQNPISSGCFKESLKTSQAVINEMTNNNAEKQGTTAEVWKAILSLGQYRHDFEEYLEDPVSTFSYPVFDSFDLVNRKIVGVLGSSTYWRQHLHGVLPDNTKGIYCVLENTRNQSFTYLIKDKVTIVGDGDHHDKKYDYLEKSSVMSQYISKISSPATKSYTSATLNFDFCDYTLKVYPSAAAENEYVNGTPLTMMVIILCVFLFTSLVFVMYTIAVARRQAVVMNRAVASSAIVSSLFPSQVRDQIYQEKNDASGGGTRPKLWMRDLNDPTMERAPTTGSTTSRPIAQLFEHTTIMFADMAGFTQWSAKRTPVQVFELLETIYHAFDAIAVRRKVFKVETIGDCYVAVTGLPDPQVDHATIMAKFASACLSKMSELTTELAAALGADTAQLTLRVGLHSGSVTGGVLRGEKSRFQLFGDTMNTAARMESTGEAGRIHVSQQTADELVAHGKSSWVTSRTDLVVAKGKGELQTYWMVPRVTAGSVTATTVEASHEPLANLKKSDSKDVESVEI